MAIPDIGETNRSAELLPMRDDNERPAVRIGGALVFVYFDRAGVLRVSIDTSATADDPLALPPSDNDGVPAVRVDVNDETVYRSPAGH